MLDIIAVSTEACDRATAYHMSNKIVRREDGVYITWLDSDYRTMLARVNPTSRAMDAPMALARGNDNHCGASMVSGNDGKLHVMCGAHAAGFIYRWSDSPADPRSWSLPQGVGASATYPSMICDARNTLHLVYRGSTSNAPWGLHYNTRPEQGDWGWPFVLVEASTPLYTYWTNSLALGPDASMHLVLEFYKTYRDNIIPAHSMAVAHLESTDYGKSWRHTDGRQVDLVPVRLEDTSPVKFDGGGNMRPGNVVVLPNNQPAFTIYDSNRATLELAIRQENRTWRMTDLTSRLQEIKPGYVPSFSGQIAVDKTGYLLVVASISQINEWSHPSMELHALKIDPANGEVVAHQPIPKTKQDEPDWLASIEKVVGIPDDEPFLLYTSGRTGKGCVNAAQCRVLFTQLHF